MHTSMEYIMSKNPKILPWIARKAGISEARVEALWNVAAGRAAKAGRQGDAEYYRVAMECLHQLVGRETAAGA